MKRVIIPIFFLLLLGSSACISYRKRPAQLYSQVISSGKTFDAAIVPGVPFWGTRWDSIMKGRVIWASHLYKQGIIKNIIFSGGAVYSPYYEAVIMGLYAQQLGIPATHIFYDTLAEHSTENIYYSYELARKNGFKTIALVTDPFQSSLTKRFTRRRFGTHIQHIPFMVDTLKKYNHIEPAIHPAPAHVQNFNSIKNRESRFKRLRGTLGAFIPWEKKSRRKAPPL